MKLIIFFLIITSHAFPQFTDKDIWEDEDFKDMDQREVEKHKETLLRHDTIIYDENEETGVKDFKYYTGEDRNRLSLHYHANPDPRNIFTFSGLEAMYARKWGIFWLEGFGSAMTSEFDQISENKDSATLGNGLKPEDLSEQLLIFGLGISYRFKLYLHWANFDRMFQTIAAYGTYVNVTESLSEVNSTNFGGLPTTDQRYSGYGMRADYGIHYRANSGLHYGFKFSYQLSTVTRDAISDTESRSDRSMTLSWLSFVADLSFYF